MSLHYLLDGYNIIRRNPRLSLDDLAEARLALCRFIEAHQLRGSARNRITVVFDGRKDVNYPNLHTPLNVVFSQDKSADEEIINLVRKSKHPATLVVVSNDRHLTLTCRSLGARIISVSEFLQKKKTNERIREEKEISFDAQYKITSEMSKIWLGPRKHSK